MSNWTPKKIEALRKRLKMSRAEFAEQLGVSRTHVLYIEKGQRKPSNVLCKLLDVVAKT